MAQDLKCLKCQGEMVQGFIPDQAHATKLVPYWVEGQPKRSFFTGDIKNIPVEGGIPIAAFRCHSCGYLEFYAGAKFAAQ